jgi:MFS family permease
VVVALTGLVGFGMGGVVAAALQGFPSQPSGTWLPWQSAVFGAVEGIIGGASLGAALGYLESRRPAEERGTTAR